MLNLLSNWKLYLLSLALIGVLSSNILQRFKIEKLEGNVQVCQSNAIAMQLTIDAAQDASKRLESHLRLREQEAAKARAESLKRMDEIMKMEIKPGCDNAIRFLIEQAN